MITFERLHTLLYYDEDTGYFFWKEKSSKKSNIKEGQVAGSVGKNGYVQITLDWKQYRGHNLAYFYMTGEYVQGIDHINGIKHDNSWTNLRRCNQKENSANSKLAITNTTGVKGVTLDKSSKLFVAQVMSQGERYRRCFKSLEEATIWVTEIRNLLHKEFANHG